MKKTLIALSLLAVSSVSMADVVLYGRIRGGIEVSKVEGVKGTKTELIDYTSTIGFKGQEQLNHDLKAIWQLEQRVDILGGGSSSTQRGFGTRNSYVGLKGGFGEFRVGYQHSPLGDYLDNYDIWESSNVLPTSLKVYDRGTDVVKRRVSAQYTTPNTNGFEARLYVSPSDNNDTSKESTVYGIGMHYKPETGYFADVLAGYVRNGENNVSSKKAGYQVATNVGYQNDKFLVRGAYQLASNVDKNPFGLTGYNRYVNRLHSVTLSGKFYTQTPDHGFIPKASVAYGWGIKDTNANGLDKAKFMGNGKYWQVIVGTDYKFSKRTTANLQAGYLEAGKDTVERKKLQTYALGLGLRHDF